MASGYVKSKTKQQQEHNRNTLSSIHGKKRGILQDCFLSSGGIAWGNEEKPIQTEDIK